MRRCKKIIQIKKDVPSIARLSSFFSFRFNRRELISSWFATVDASKNSKKKFPAPGMVVNVEREVTKSRRIRLWYNFKKIWWRSWRCWPRWNHHKHWRPNGPETTRTMYCNHRQDYSCNQTSFAQGKYIIARVTRKASVRYFHFRHFLLCVWV